MITVSEETSVDFESTALIATEAFGSKHVKFSPQRMKWLYERGFGEGAAVVAAFDGDKKVGQIVLLHQKVHLDGAPVVATQLIDLFILQAYRSPVLVRRIYKEAERICEAKQVRVILGLPNPISAPLNARFMKVHPFLLLPTRIGISAGWPRGAVVQFSADIKAMPKDEALGACRPLRRPPRRTGCTGTGRRSTTASAIRPANTPFMRPTISCWSPLRARDAVSATRCCAASSRARAPKSRQPISAP